MVKHFPKHLPWFLSLLLVAPVSVGDTITVANQSPHVSSIEFFLPEPMRATVYELQSPRRLFIGIQNSQYQQAAIEKVLVTLPTHFIDAYSVEKKGSLHLLKLFLPAHVNIQEVFTSDKLKVVLTTTAKSLTSSPSSPPPLKIVPAPLVPKKSLTNKQKNLVIIIDPGHGGKDPGALGSKTKEKTVNLRAAKMLQKKLSKLANVKVLMTRTTDVFIPLQKRVEFASKHRAGLFISLHSDASRSKKPSGASLYALSIIAANKKSNRLLRRSGDPVIGHGTIKLKQKEKALARTLLDLSSKKSLEISTELGKVMVPELKKVTKMHSDRIRPAAFQVLKSFDFPSLLIEMGFISNRRDELNLMSKNFLSKLTDAMTQGIRKFLTKVYPNFIDHYAHN